MLHDLVIIFYCWFLSTLWIFISLPFVTTFTKSILKDAGWAMNRVIGWLMIGLAVWYLAHLGIPINTKPGIWIVFFVLLGTSLYFWRKNRFQLGEFFKTHKTLIIVEEVLFLFGIFFLSIIRGFSPDINSLEKFMDGGLMVSYIKSPTLPIEDMWLAGETFNYYTFGHFQGAIATQFWSIDHAQTYNILLGLLMGLTLQMSFSVVINIITLLRTHSEKIAEKVTAKASQIKKSATKAVKTLEPSQKKNTISLVVVGIIGAYLVTFAGNTQTIWYLFARCHSLMTQTPTKFSPADENNKEVISDACNFVGYWYPNATRFIPRTIHEFPSYSFIVSDLHAHVWNLAHVLLFLLVIMVWGEKLFQSSEKEADSKVNFEWMMLNGLLGLIMGIFIMTSSWDGLVYSLFMAVLGSVILIVRPKLIVKIVLCAIIMLLVMFISSSPWWLNFKSISQGPALAGENDHTVWWQLVALWFSHIFVGVIGTSLILYRQKLKKTVTFSQLLTLTLFISGLLLIFLPEIFYLKDIYTTQPRANTMFKLTYQSFILLSLLMAITIGFLSSFQEIPKIIRKVVLAVILLLVISVGIYPYFGYRDYYLGGVVVESKNIFESFVKYADAYNKKYKGLDGLQWMEEQYPNDYKAYLWLTEVEGRPHILEAVGDSYTTYNRMSAFTGLPTVLGWRVHEWLWRGSYDIPGKRSGEVEKMYLEPLSEDSQTLYNTYKVKYVIVGDKEFEAYPELNPADMKKLGRVVFEEGNTFIVER